jgi:hypothetical protein
VLATAVFAEGDRMSGMLTCPSCALEMPPGSRFCERCGKPLVPGAATAVAAAPTDPGAPTNDPADASGFVIPTTAPPPATPAAAAFVPTAPEPRRPLVWWLFMQVVLDAIDHGMLVLVVSVLLRVLSVLSLVGGLVGAIAVIVRLAEWEPPAKLVIAASIAILLLLAVQWMAAQILWCRGRQVGELSRARFTLVPMVALTLRTFGELVALGVVFAAVVGAVAGVIMGDEARMLTGMLPDPLDDFAGGGGFFGALLSLLWGAIASVLVLLWFHFLAEMVELLAAIANNTDRMARGLPR